MAGTVFAAVAVMLHWLQVQKIFDPETGLPTLHAPITTLLVVVLVLVAAALWWLSGRMKTDCAPEEPEDALALPHRETGWILIAAAALAALGSAYLFFKEASTLMKAAALLGILSAPVLAMMPQIPRWGGFGAALSVLPVLFFCLWLVVFYKENAANPILWSYGMEILAIAMCLLAVFRLSAYLFLPRQAAPGDLCVHARAHNEPSPRSPTASLSRRARRARRLGYRHRGHVLDHHQQFRSSRAGGRYILKSPCVKETPPSKTFCHLPC